MEKKLYFFKNDDAKTFRIVKQVNSDTFIVVKLVTQGVNTLKFWKGSSIGKTASYWTTKAFEPDDDLRSELTSKFQSVLKSFQTPLSVVNGWAAKKLNKEVI